MKALLVEDNFINQKAQQLILEDLTSRVDVANNAREAFKLFEQYHYDLALIDIGLPDVSGIEVARLFRTHNMKMEIILTSTHVTESVKENCTAAGIHIVLPKPLNSKLLKEKIQHCLSAADAQEERSVVFTSREMECVNQLFRRKTLDQVSEALNVKKSSLYFHLKNIEKKFELLAAICKQ